MSFSKLFKKETSQQRLTLDQSEWLVLKELATYFLSVDFPGSQLEALLRARASLQIPNTDDITASILTPSPAVLTTLSASGLVVNADTQTIQPPLVPSPADRTASPTRQSSPSPQSVLEPEPESVSESHPGPSIVDNSFQNCIIDGSGSSVPLVVDNFSHYTENNHTPMITSAFSHSTIRDATINSHCYNGNVDCFNNSRVSVPQVMTNFYRY